MSQVMVLARAGESIIGDHPDLFSSLCDVHSHVVAGTAEQVGKWG